MKGRDFSRAAENRKTAGLQPLRDGFVRFAIAYGTLRGQFWTAGLLAAVVTGAAAFGQFIGNTPGRTLPGTPPVTYLYPEQVHLAAGKPADVALHFRVVEGMHINSHTPHDEFLIPTRFSIPAGEGVRLESTNYPAGTDIALPSAPQTRMNVYSGEFILQTRIVAARGNHLVRGKLHFQACNETQCLPPQTITAAVDVVAR